MPDFMDDLRKSKRESARPRPRPVRNWLLKQEAKFNPGVFTPRSTDEGPRSLNMLRQEGEATDKFSHYWGTPVFGKAPLDMFVQLAGMGAKAIAPDEWSGRLGGDLQQMGAEAHKERVKREYERPNILLERRLREAQLSKTEMEIEQLREAVPDEWDAFYRAKKGEGLNDAEIVSAYHEARRAPEAPKYSYTKGNDEVLVFRDGKEVDRIKLTPKERQEGNRVIYFADGTAALVDSYGDTVKTFEGVHIRESSPTPRTWVTADGTPVTQIGTDFWIRDDNTGENRLALPQEVQNLTSVPAGKSKLGIDRLATKEGGETVSPWQHLLQ